MYICTEHADVYAATAQDVCQMKNEIGETCMWLEQKDCIVKYCNFLYLVCFEVSSAARLCCFWNSDLPVSSIFLITLSKVHNSVTFFERAHYSE